jgi:hypothetical protein
MRVTAHLKISVQQFGRSSKTNCFLSAINRAMAKLQKNAKMLSISPALILQHGAGDFYWLGKPKQADNYNKVGADAEAGSQ